MRLQRLKLSTNILTPCVKRLGLAFGGKWKMTTPPAVTPPASVIRAVVRMSQRMAVLFLVFLSPETWKRGHIGMAPTQGFVSGRLPKIPPAVLKVTLQSHRRYGSINTRAQSLRQSIIILGIRIIRHRLLSRAVVISLAVTQTT